jgi:hypothetical protein
MAQNTTPSILEDVAPRLPVVSYREQYERVRDEDMAPLRGVDADMAHGAETLEENARANALRRFASIDPTIVER